MNECLTAPRTQFRSYGCQTMVIMSKPMVNFQLKKDDNGKGLVESEYQVKNLYGLLPHKASV